MQNKSYTINELAKLINARVQGNGETLINAVAPLDKAKNNQISFLGNPRYKSLLLTTQASVVILTISDAADCPTAALIVDNPYLAHAKLAKLFQQLPAINPGIHPTASIGKHCQISTGVSIGAHCVIEDNVQIGANTVIGAGTTVGEGSNIGTDCHIWANVTLYYQVKVGNRAIVHSGVVIGADGFGMANEQGKWYKIPQLGRVIIGDDVEIGANTTIDRGALEDTVIENGVKLDNQIQIAHNVHIGEDTIIAGCTGIAGSAKIGKRCMIGGGVRINGHIEIADEVILTATATVVNSITSSGIYSSGMGVLPHREAKKCAARYRKLDDIVKRLNQLEKIVNEPNGH